MKVDTIGEWSEDKLEILKAYAQACSKVIQAQEHNGGRRFKHVYIDGFAGAGEHISKADGRYVPGSPLNALSVEPPFNEYHFVDMDEDRVANLRHHSRHQQNAHVYHGDCNQVLLSQVFPRVRWDKFERALCFLDPYGMQLDWKVLEAAGKSRAIEIFLNFPIMDINRNVKVANPKPADVARFVRFWGDETGLMSFHRDSGQFNLFGPDTEVEKNDNDGIVEAFRERLQTTAGFAYVPKAVAMRNSRGPIVYYLFFAGPNSTGARIANDIFKSYRT